MDFSVFASEKTIWYANIREASDYVRSGGLMVFVLEEKAFCM